MRNDGYNLEIRNGYLLVKDVPYVTASATVREDGVLIAKLDTQVIEGQERTRKPDNHVAYWTGEHPCHADGSKLRSFENPSEAQDFGGGVKADFTFSACNNYRDYEHKMLGYLGWIVGEARKLRDVTAQTHPIKALCESLAARPRNRIISTAGCPSARMMRPRTSIRPTSRLLNSTRLMRRLP